MATPGPVANIHVFYEYFANLGPASDEAAKSMLPAGGAAGGQKRKTPLICYFLATMMKIDERREC